MHLSTSELYQLKLIKNKSPIERFYMMASLINDQIKFMKEGIRYRNPSASEQELQICFKKKMMEIYSLKR